MTERDVGELLGTLARSMRMPGDRRRNPVEQTSDARRLGWPEWLWDEHEQSPACRARQERLAKTQCKSGEAIARHLRLGEDIL